MDIENQTQDGTSQVHGGTSFLKTCFHGFNALTGVGMLSIPYALSEGGWLSLILLFILAALLCYTGFLLKQCMDAGPVVRTYQDIGGLAFGNKGRFVVTIFLFLELYLVAVEFLILEGDNLAKLFPELSFKIAGHKFVGSQGFIIISALVFLPTVWLRSMKLLAYVSAGGVVAIAILLFCVFWVGIVDGVGFSNHGKLFSFTGNPTAISIYAFCYCGHSMFPTICSSMKDKTQFNKVLITCFVLCTLSYGSMAILGYLMFGDTVKSQVTLSLPVEKLSSKIAIYTTIINPLARYALVLTPIVTAMEDAFIFNNNVITSIATRTILVATTVLIALIFPFFGYLMALIGSTVSMGLSVLFPCICYIKICKGCRRSKGELTTVVVVMMVGCFIAIVGTYTAVHKIIHNLQ